TAPALREKEVPEAALARLCLQLLHDRGDLPARWPRVELVVEDLLVRVDVLVHEVRELLHVHLGFLRVLEFHVGLPSRWARSRLYPPAGPCGTAPGQGRQIANRVGDHEPWVVRHAQSEDFGHDRPGVSAELGLGVEPLLADKGGRRGYERRS